MRTKIFLIALLSLCLPLCSKAADATIANAPGGAITTVPDAYRMPWENPAVQGYYITFANLTNQILTGYAGQAYANTAAQNATNNFPWMTEALITNALGATLWKNISGNSATATSASTINGLQALTNGHSVNITVSNAISVQSGVNGINSYGANLTNAFELSTAYRSKAFTLNTNGDAYLGNGAVGTVYAAGFQKIGTASVAYGPSSEGISIGVGYIQHASGSGVDLYQGASLIPIRYQSSDPNVILRTNVLVIGTLTATNGVTVPNSAAGFFYKPDTNGVVGAMTNYTPVHAWGSIMSWSTNLINGGANTYAVITNSGGALATLRTNQFATIGTNGVLRNLLAGYYRCEVHLSGVAVDNSALVEGDLLLNGVERDEVSFLTAFDNPPRLKGMSAFGILYIPANTDISFQVKSSGAGGINIYRQQMVIGSP